MLTIKNLSTSAGATTIIRKNTKTPASIIKINPAVGGTYVLKVKKSGKVLGVRNASTKAGTAVEQRTWSKYNSQRWYIIKKGSYYLFQASFCKKVLTVTGNSSSDNTAVVMQSYTGASGQLWKIAKYTETDPTDKNRIYKTTINGKKTLTTLLKNALVPCGRTLYIWGGGWGGVGSDSSIIGYQSSWLTWFKAHATSDYDYTKYRYQYGNGLDCSGYVAWTVYNTIYTTSGKSSIVTSSTNVASTYAKKGWCTLVSSSDKTYKPGDIISMDGHVWISLGQYSDGSVLLIHSSPKGVQISGTAGTAAVKASYYMTKYFPAWPYAARTVSSGYLNYVGKGRWKTSGTGSILTDPDGIQSMSADQVMKFLLGT